MADSKRINYAIFKRQQYLSLTEIAYNVLLQAIINQDFHPGAPISIDSLAKQLNMSNTPVREALMRAQGERLVTQKTNRGFVVSDILRQAELQQLFEVRYILEVHALSIAKLSDEMVEEVRQLVRRMENTGDGTAYNEYGEYMISDREFHHALVKSANNVFLLNAWEGLHVHLHLSRLYTGIGLFDRLDSINEHQAILEALERADNAAAANLLGDHIKRVEKRMLSFLAT